MKKIAFVVSLVALLACSQMQAQHELSPTDFEKRMNQEKVQILDVRTAGEFQQVHLTKSLQANWLDKDEFLERINYLNKKLPLLVYCASGARSAAAMAYLKEMGFEDVVNLRGGLSNWRMENKAVEMAKQVAQMTVPAYQSLTKSAPLVLVDFGAEWCPPCKIMEPILAQLVKEQPNQFSLVKVDGGADIEVMKLMQVTALPVFVVYKNGVQIWRKQGVVTKKELEAVFKN